jgi:hypothetical protein
MASPALAQPELVIDDFKDSADSANPTDLSKGEGLSRDRERALRDSPHVSYRQGDVEVTGDIRLSNADGVEDFDIRLGVVAEPGTVMVLGDHCALVPYQSAYDTCVAGVVSGAGDYKPGIVLDTQPSSLNRRPVIRTAGRIHRTGSR